MDRLKTLRDKWEEATPVTKVLLAVIASLLFSLTLMITWRLNRVEMVPLASGIPLEDVSRITARLDELGAKYQLAGSGNTILVEKPMQQRLKVDLAGSGAHFGKDPGFELFENSQLQRSDFSERVTYLRALQGELSATISSLPEIKHARVHLNIPREALFLDEASVPTASVFLDLQPGTKLSAKQVSGILHLVAGGVDGMEAKDVTLMDASGAIHLSGQELETGMGQGADEPDRALALTTAAQGLVDRILGPGRGVVRVQVEYSNDRRRMERDTLEPGADGKGIPLLQESTEETFVGTRKGRSEDDEEPQAPNQPVVQNGPGDGPEKPSYGQKTNKIKYEVSRVKETIEQKPGTISRVTTSVLIDTELGLSPEELAALAEGVKGAVGYSAPRGDSFILESVSFRRDHLEKIEAEIAAEEDAADQKDKNLMMLLGAVGGFFTLTVLSFMLYRWRAKKRALAPLRQAEPEPERETVWLDVEMKNPEDESPELLEEELIEQQESDFGLGVDPTEIDLTLDAEMPTFEPYIDRDVLLREAAIIAGEQPALVARIIEQWITE